MGKPNFSDEFKRDAVAQITERGYPVAEVSQRLGVSQHSLYAWKRQLAKVVSGDASKDAEIRQLKRELARVTEERDILKNGPGLSPPVWGRNGPCYGVHQEGRGRSLIGGMISR
ncbi:Transposase [Novosphingobium resinovorum]|uniref:Transposase n=1 Tax=Novosphingobium resinovorum TaxID=158500 RepID=A0A031JSZ0_9SPHN|nr:Transposase [Novosphingobium resinovorum]